MKSCDLELEEMNLAEAKLLKTILKTALIVSIDLKKHLDLRFKGGIQCLKSELGSAIERLWKKGERGKIVRNKNRGEKNE